MNVRRTSRTVAACRTGTSAAAVATLAVALVAAAWPTFDYNAARSGYDPADLSLSAANVGKLRLLWRTRLGSVADSAPIYLPDVPVRGRKTRMLFITAKDGTTYGIDAATGTVAWRFMTRGPNITTSTPVADRAAHVLYVPGVDGYVHRVDLATGRELAGRGFPVRITTMPITEKDASSLNLWDGYLYAVTSGYLGDATPYDGHVVAIRLSDGVTHVFNSLCSNLRALPTPTSCPEQRSGIWARAGAVVDPDPAMRGHVYVATGNGDFNASSGGHDYGDSVIALSREGSRVEGYYAPADYESLESGDVDLGSSAPALLPREALSRTPLLAVQGGKDGILRLLDRAHLGGVGAELQRVDLGDRLFSAPSVWSDGATTTIFIGLPDGLKAYRVDTDRRGTTRLEFAWSTHLSEGSPEGSSPVVVNGVVFLASSGAVFAFDARTGHTLWSTAAPSAGGSIGDIHWQSPIAVDGAVYCADEDARLTAYAVRR